MEGTKIQWTDETINFWHGCKKVSDGCKYCYMYRDKERFNQDATKVIRSSKPIWDKAYKFKEPKKIFTCSWSDFFIEEADEWRPEAWKVIKDNPQHTWQILTKRPERINDHLPDDWGEGYDNVWLGISVESMGVFITRHNYFLEVNAKVRFISFEPLLSVIGAMSGAYDWIIIGGESGNDNGNYRYRECKLKWFEFLITMAGVKNIKVFVKQLGTHLSKELKLKDRHGGNIDEWHKELQIREFPNGNN